MKTLLTTFAFLLLLPCLGQGLNGELGFNANYNQESRGVVCINEYAYFVKRQNTAYSFFTTCSLLKIDTLENVIWEMSISPTFAEFIDVHEIIPSETGGVYVLGSGWPTCDVAMDCFLFLQKFDPSGSLIWTKTWDNPNCFEVNLTGLTNDQNNSLLLNYSDQTVSTIYTIDFNGTATDSLSVPTNNLEQINNHSSFEKIASKGDTLYAFDNSGVPVSTVSFTSTIEDYLIINDTTFLLTQDSIFAFDPTLTIINGTNLASYSNYSNLKDLNGELQFISHSALNQSILRLNHQLQLLDVTTIVTGIGSNDPRDFNTTHFVASQNFPLTQFYAIRHLDYSLQSAQDELVNWTDIGVIDFAVTQLNASATSMQDIYEIAIEGDVLIKNFGNKLLNACRLNHFIQQSIACGYNIYTEAFSNLNLAPGDSMWISLGSMHYEVNYFPDDTIVKSICLYTSHPNNKTDLIVPNDEYCENVILGYANLSEVKSGEKEIIRITDLMGRECEAQPNVLLIYVYSDGTTEKVFKIK